MPPRETKASGSGAKEESSGRVTVRGSTRATPRWLFVLAAVLLIARVATGIQEHAQARPPVDRVAWVPMEQAEAQAQSTGKAILYDFSAASSRPCRRMAREVFTDSTMARIISTQYVPVQVIDRSREDGRNSAAIDSLQAVYRVRSFPTLVVFHPQTGEHETAEGYESRGKTARFLQDPAGKLHIRPFLPQGTPPADSGR
ncbi:MAG: thioredoxin family protein [Candidatus Eisenbacteria bacterium]